MGKFVSYLVQSGVAVFEPENYDASQHTPSPIFIKSLEPSGPVPNDWKVAPLFSKCFGRSMARFEIEGADLYGTGEVCGSLRRNGDSQTFWNTENPTYYLFKGKQLYESHPWVMGVRADGTSFGIIADTTWKSSLSMKDGICFRSKGPAFRVVVIEKDSPEAVISTLSALSGKIELPPLWALGYQQCRYSYYPQEQAAGIADAMRRHRIPCDVIWLDIHYMDKYKVFTFNPEGFADPRALNAHLHEKNFKAVYMIDPGIKAENGYFVDDQGIAGDHFVRDKKGRIYHGKVWPGECHFPDFTDPDTCSWWVGLYKDFLATGIDGVWNDMNEPSVFTSFGGTIPVSARHKGGNGLPAATHARYHNIYGYLMVKATREAVKTAKPDKRPFVLSRSNFLGGQRYAAMWTGDNYSDWGQMKEAVPMCLNIGLSAQPFNGPDIGGFLRDCTAELLRHWTACGVYFPFVRNHSCTGTANQEPWAFDSQTEDVCRTAIERRYRLLPYYYTLFEEASRNGLPVMRPTFWADFKDVSLRSEQQSFLVGNDLLVIPRWSESPALPKGEWRIFSFENEDDGYQSYLAVRPGAVIPAAEVFQNTVEYNLDRLTLIVNPDSSGSAAGVMYEDEGDGYAYQEGMFARYEFTVNTTMGLTIARTEGGMKIGHSRKVRIALVCGSTTNYSEWFDWNPDSEPGEAVSVAKIPAVPDSERPVISLSELKFIHLENGALSRPYTKKELIMTNIVK